MKNLIHIKGYAFYSLKFDLKMKLTIYLFLISLFQVHASSYSQNTKISLQLKDVSIEKVLRAIEFQTEFKILYNDNEVDYKRLVSVDFKKENVSKILDAIFYQTPVSYEVFDKQIILKLKIQPKKAVESYEINLPVDQQVSISGIITDKEGLPLPGVTVVIEGTKKGTQSDFNGKYNIKVNKGAVLIVSYVGMKTKKITVGDKSTINVVLEEDAAALDEVIIQTSFGQQKKKSIVASITTVKPAELKVASSNLTTALAGRVAGLIGYQRGGEPGKDDAAFFIRGVTTFGYGSSPLILIDGVELEVSDLRRLQPDDIEAFSILKDATATALYGARGANGVIYVTTKEGIEGKMAINVRMESSFSSSTKDIEFADPITYMQLANESVRTRNALAPTPYSQKKLENTIAGTNPLLYPTVDWQKSLFQDFAVNNRANINLRGGGKVARYFVSLAASQDNGILSVPKLSNFNNNVDYKSYNFRSNTNINLNKTTELKLSFNVSFDNYVGPIQGGKGTYEMVVRSNPVRFQPYYEKDAEHAFTKHILFGNYDDSSLGGGAFLLNPYAELVKGYQESANTKAIARVELKKDLSSWAEGLNYKFIYNTTRRSAYSINRSYRPFYYQPSQNPETGAVSLNILNENTGSAQLDFNEGADPIIESTTYLESRFTYINQINDDNYLSGLLVMTLNNRLASVGSGTNLQATLPYRNMGVSGRFTYGYKDKYFAEFNFGYNGSERFAKNERWGFFPSAGFGWIASEEDFFEPLSDVITNLKFKGSYGLVGNDRIGDENDRFFYLSNVSLNSGVFTTGQDFNESHRGVSIQRYANSKITWETSKKLNLGVELELFNNFELIVDVFSEKRENILADRIVPSSLGLQADVSANIGEAKSNGIDGSIVYTADFGQDAFFQVRGNFTYAKNEVTKIEEPDYSSTPWLSRIGQPINQDFGLVAERLFVDQDEVNNSPEQQFGVYSGGDIKYKDINNDGKITNLDRVAIGNPRTPQIVYGVGFSGGYKGFDLSCFFQGAANSSFWVNPEATAPFINYNDPNTPVLPGIGNNQLLKVWADDHWSEANRNVYAKWPRLSNEVNSNNTQHSTWFMQDGAFLRLKTVEMGYSLPQVLTEKLGLVKARMYMSANNLFTFSKFKLWDPELAGNGLGYPNQRVFNIGLNVSL